MGRAACPARCPARPDNWPGPALPKYILGTFFRAGPGDFLPGSGGRTGPPGTMNTPSL